MPKPEDLRVWGAVVGGERIADDPVGHKYHYDATSWEVLIYQEKNGPFRIHVGSWGVVGSDVSDTTLNEVLQGHPTTVVNPGNVVPLMEKQTPLFVRPCVTLDARGEIKDYLYQIRGGK